MAGSDAGGQAALEPYHLGIVVADVAVAAAELGTALGLSWGRPQSVHGTGETDFVFSLQGPPYYELIRVVPATIWAEPGLHHVAVWCGDLAAAGDRLVVEGWQWEQGKYFRSPAGIRHELVPRAGYQPRLERYLAGGDMFGPGDGPESYQGR